MDPMGSVSTDRTKGELQWSALLIQAEVEALLVYLGKEALSWALRSLGRSNLEEITVTASSMSSYQMQASPYIICVRAK